jgi:hypothetical protein
VPQNPSDEPASELLKRITAERENRARVTPVESRVARTKSTARNGRRGRPKLSKDQ